MRNSKGSALLPVLIISAAVVGTSLVLLQSSAQLSKSYAQQAYSKLGDNVSTMIGTIATDPVACMGGFVPSDQGLLFWNGSAFGSTFNLAWATGTNTVDVSVPSSYPTSPGATTHLRYASNLTLPEVPFKISRLYLANATQTAALTYSMDLMVELQPISNNFSLSARKAASIQIVTNAGGQMTACGASPQTNSNQALCVNMNCQYVIDAAGNGTCSCPIQPVTCTNGTYVASVVNYVPQCSSTTVTRTCSGTPNGYLVALDSSGNPVCAQVFNCPAGTSANGLGGTANPPECSCTNAGDTWNVATSTCAPAGPPPPPPSLVNGLCGPANGGAFATAAAANAAGLCSQGTSSVASLSGTGPWNWTCNGANGGGSPSCSAIDSTVTPVTYCPDGVTVLHQSWQGVASAPTPPAYVPPMCTYPPGFVGGVTYMDSCSHMPLNSSCVSGGTEYLCLSNCSSGSSVVNGVCGSANGSTVSSAPTTNLCSSGTASAVIGTDPWIWTCSGANGGATANCSASGSNCYFKITRYTDPITNSCTVGTKFYVGDPSCTDSTVFNVDPCSNGSGTCTAATTPADLAACNSVIGCIDPDQSNPGTWQTYALPVPPGVYRSGWGGTVYLGGSLPPNGSPCGKKGYWCNLQTLSISLGGSGGGGPPPFVSVCQ